MFSICCGSKARPGWGNIASRSRSKDILGGGGSLLVISLGGPIGGILPASPRTAGDSLRFAGEGEGEIRTLFSATDLSASDSFLAASGCECTGGRDTGFPDKAARIVGLTSGWGMTFAFSSCWGVSLIIECATDFPLLNTSPCTAVVAIVR